jgi:hypothetical protein
MRSVPVKAVSNETTASKKQNTTATFHRFLFILSPFFCRGVLVFYEMTTENEDLRGQFVFNHGTPRQKTVK